MDNFSYDQRVDEILSKYDPTNLSVSNLSKIVYDLCLIAETYKDLDGLSKKKIVTSVIYKLIDKSDVFGQYETAILAIVPGLCDTLIKVKKDNSLSVQARCFNCLS